MGYLNSDAVPVGFGMGLAQNISAMKHFSGMTEAEKEEILNRARDAKSKKEMEELISSLDPLPVAPGMPVAPGTPEKIRSSKRLRRISRPHITGSYSAAMLRSLPLPPLSHPKEDKR